MSPVTSASRQFLGSRDRSQTVAGGLHGGGDERQNAQRNREERGGGKRAAGSTPSGGEWCTRFFSFSPVDLSMFL